MKAQMIGIVMAALVVCSVPLAGADVPVVKLTRTVPGSGAYTAGATIDITVELSVTGSGAIDSIGVEETIPLGWKYVSLATKTNPTILPVVNATGMLEFAWFPTPALPLTFTYRLRVPVGETGSQQIEGKSLHYVSGFLYTSLTVATTIPSSGVSEGEGSPEGVVEGEGSAEGTPDGEGQTEGTVEGEGSAEGTPEGEGQAEGTPEGEGSVEGTPEGEGQAEGVVEGEGSAEGTPEGEGQAEGTPEGEGQAEGTPEGEGQAEGTPEGEGQAEGTPEGEGQAEGMVEGEGTVEGEGSPEGVEEGEGEGEDEPGCCNGGKSLGDFRFEDLWDRLGDILLIFTSMLILVVWKRTPPL
jgi:hypothetical protein